MTGTMKRICSLTILALASGALPAHAATSCPADAVLSGPLCVDKYEASVWETSDKKTIEKIRSGEIKKAKDLAAATARGTESDDYDDGAGCPDTGSHCVALYAVSVPGVLPSRLITWFQAAAACRNSGKRLLTNAEWQAAALGTPDGPPCFVAKADDEGPAPTGTPGCTSDVGAYDMVGNVSEWVADWIDRKDANVCTTWPADYGTDLACIGHLDGDDENLPAAIFRGLNWGFMLTNRATDAGVYAFLAIDAPSKSRVSVGFRCARQP